MADDSKRAQDLAEEKALLSDLIELNEEAAKSVKTLEAAERKLSIARRTNATNTAELEKNVTKLNNGLSANAKEIQNQREVVKKAEESLELYNKRVDALADSAKGATGAMDKLFGSNMSSYIDRTKKLGLNIGAVVDGHIAYMRTLNETRVGIGRTTGMFSSLDKAFDIAQKQSRGFSGTIEENAKAMGALSVEYSRFNALSFQQQADLVTQNMLFQKLGVSAEQFAQTQEALSYAFGVTDDAILGATSAMDKFAMSTGQPISRVLNDLTSLAPELARFGSAGERVFKNLSREARQLGLTTQAAFDITELFDTFESSANAAGRLNAQLGLQLNSVELMTADSDERLELLRQEFQLQGKSFEAMGKRDMQMVADILGTDVMTAGKALGGKISLSDLAKEDSRDPKKIVTVTEAMKSAQEASYARNNEHYRNMNQKAIETVQGISANTGLLDMINTALLGLTAILAISQGVSTIKNLRQMKNMKNIDTPDVKKPSAKAPPTPGSKVRPGRIPNPDKPNSTGLKPGSTQHKQLVKAGKIPANTLPGAAGKGAAKGAGKTASKGITKGLGKAALKKIPLLGLGAGILFGAQRALSGDFVGAAMEVASGASSTVPGLGTAASVGIDAALMAKDMGAFDSKASTPSGPSDMSSMSRSARATRAASSGKPAVIKNEIHNTITIDGKPLKKYIATTSNELMAPTTPVDAIV